MLRRCDGTVRTLLGTGPSFLPDSIEGQSGNNFPDLTQEEEARKWIHSAPNAFCNTADKKILCQVLNNYDQETTDFYRWKVFYKQEELAELIHRKSGIDFGQILDLVPVNRGTSGRIEMLKIVGTHRTFTIGKELEIRRTCPKHICTARLLSWTKKIYNSISRTFVLTRGGDMA